LSGRPDGEPLAWYVAYGSNLRLDRLRCYLAGGRPPGAGRRHVGSQNPADPLDIRRIRLAGGIRFAGRSTLWGGGVAFFDPEAEGRVAARAYLLTLEQLNDLVSQETRRPRDTDLRLDRVTRHRPGTLAAACYETVLHVGERSGWPMLTITSRRDLDPAAPAAAYLWSIAAGLAEGFSWAPAAIADYLVRAPGVAPVWTHDQVTALVSVSEREVVGARNSAHLP
jgi:hypothetical protein